MNKESINTSCTFIVSSCDAYQDLWEPFFFLKNKYWPDCPFTTILISETEQSRIPGVNVFNPGKLFSWSLMLKKTIEHSKTPYILLSMEDFFLQSTIDTNKVLSLLNYVQSNDINMLRLIPRPGPDTSTEIFTNVGTISKKASYRVSGQAAFWKSSTILNLLDDQESLWEFEINATNRSIIYDGFQSVKKPVLTYRHHVIERGKWFPWSAFKFKKMGIGVDLKSRQIMSGFETFRWLIHKTFTPAIVFLPEWLKKIIKPILIKIKILKY